MIAQTYIAVGTGATLQGAALSLTAAITLNSANVTRERGGVVNTFTFSSTGSESPSPSISPSQVESRWRCSLHWQLVLDIHDFLFAGGHIQPNPLGRCVSVANGDS